MLVGNHLRQAEVLVAQSAAGAAFYFCRERKQRGARYGSATRPQVRRSVRDIYLCLGDQYFRRAYRMSYQSFCKLHEELKDGIKKAHKVALERRKKQRRALQRQRRGTRRRLNNPPLPPIPNGNIHTSVRLASSLRYFSGGSPYDVMPQYGISHTEVLDSVWYVVESTNKVEEWYITYPTDHNEQLRLAYEFKAKSGVDFDVCAGAIDGILIWILKPTLAEAKMVGIDQQKFFCGRKNKFRLNCQAVCDVRGRFLDLSITYGGASSDLLAFENSKLYNLLEDGLLADGLLIFGDNAYPNTRYMATPYPATNGGPKDNYNFYHSQLRIRIECAFGMLVQRWGILRMAMPLGLSIKKTIAMVNALAKLHNFCIDEVDGSSGDYSVVDHPLAEDAANIVNCPDGSVPVVRNDQVHEILGINVDTPESLIGGGEHFDDVPRANRRRRDVDQSMLPRTKLCKHVEDTHKVRPSCRRRK